MDRSRKLRRRHTERGAKITETGAQEIAGSHNQASRQREADTPQTETHISTSGTEQCCQNQLAKENSTMRNRAFQAETADNYRGR